MKRISILVAAVLVVVVCHVFAVGSTGSPLYKARLEETLSQWERGSSCGASGGDDPTGWPASLHPVSYCLGSVCLGSYCLGSACLSSNCIGSGCVASLCLGSGCVCSACGGSSCLGVTLCVRQCGHNGDPTNTIDYGFGGMTSSSAACMAY